MTGSGSAVFAQIFEETDLLDAPGSWLVRKCKNLEMHPLAGW
jgi:4-diphosphocytidyl-2-C-methyl-D-erythritol kinase